MSIELKQVHVLRDGRPILQDLSLTLPERGIVGLSGPSGCGKTTLLHTLCGLLKPDSGTVSGLARGRVGVAFQEDRLLPGLTVRDNLDLVLHDRTRAEVWLERMQLAGQGSQFPHQLSGGMKRRIALARALAFDSDLILLDEPFQGMDDALKQNLYGWVREAAGTRPLLLVTHDAAECDALAGTMWLADGPPLVIFHSR